MKTANKPIHPTGASQSGTGITLLEHYAGLAMQDQIVNSPLNMSDAVIKHIAKDSIAVAKELIKQLEQI